MPPKKPRTWRGNVLQREAGVPRALGPLQDAFLWLNANWPGGQPAFSLQAAPPVVAGGPTTDDPDGDGPLVARFHAAAAAGVAASTVSVAAEVGIARVNFTTKGGDPAEAVLQGLGPGAARLSYLASDPEGPCKTPLCSLNRTRDWKNKRSNGPPVVYRRYTAVGKLERGLLFQLGRFVGDLQVNPMGLVFPCAAGQVVREQFALVRKAFATEHLRSESVTAVAHSPTRPVWVGEGTAADAVFAPSGFEGTPWGAVRKAAVCFVFEDSDGKSGDSKVAVMQILATGILLELHREARRRHCVSAGGQPSAHLRRPVVVMAFPKGWDTVAFQDARDDEVCRVWRFEFGVGTPPVQVTRSWLVPLWDAVCYGYHHCS